MPSFEYARAGIAAVMATADGRYLMQIRDDKPDIPYPGYTCLFGGAIEAGESAEQAMLRELLEELRFAPARYAYLTELVYPRRVNGVTEFVHDTHFLVPITPEDVAGMELHEGAGMELLALPDIVTRRIVPWDLCGVLYHATGTLAAG